jgi:predicted O-methyltransferase YrrM
MDSLLKAITLHAIGYSVPVISDATAHFLSSHLLETKPLLVWEIGSAIWRSSAIFATTVAQRWWRMFSCEISLPSYRFARNHLYAHGIHNCTIYHGDATKIQWSALIAQESVDYVFVDAAKREYLSYIQIVRPFVKKWWIIVCDDVLMYAHKTWDIASFIVSQWGSYEIVPLSDNDGLLIARR